MQRKMVLLFLSLTVCLPAQAQTRGGGGRMVTSKAQVSGVTNPERCLLPSGCTEESAQDAPKTLAPLGVPIPDGSFYKASVIWSYQQLPSDCVALVPGGAYATVFDSDFTTTQGSDRLTIVVNGQATILGGNNVGFADSIYLKCTVTQGVISTACPTTPNEPAIVQQVNTAPTRVGQIGFFSYTGSLQVAKNTLTNVKIEVSTWNTAGQICYAGMLTGF
jgi:hypothetical protein